MGFRVYGVGGRVRGMWAVAPLNPKPFWGFRRRVLGVGSSVEVLASKVEEMGITAVLGLRV